MHKRMGLLFCLVCVFTWCAHSTTGEWQTTEHALCAVANPSTTTAVIVAGQPYSIEWLMPTTTTVSATDPTPVALLLNGFYLQWNTGGKVDVGIGSAQLTRFPPCGAQTTNPGMVAYRFRTKSGMPVGNHKITVSAYVTVRNPDGTVNSKLEGTVATAPFVSSSR